MVMTRLGTRFYTDDLWDRRRWLERERPLRGFLVAFGRDVLAVQELRDYIDPALPGDRRVVDAAAGWSPASNPRWRDGCAPVVGATAPLRHTRHAHEAATGESRLSSRPGRSSRRSSKSAVTVRRFG